MISVPGAVSKAIFDMVRDYFRTRRKKNIDAETQVPPRRSLNLEEGIHLHRADSNAHSERQSTISGPSAGKQERQSSSNEGNNQVATDIRANSETVLVTEPSHPQTISLLPYLKEKTKGTKLQSTINTFVRRFPTFSATLGRLPYALLPFAFSQFILVEALSYTGWITLFSSWMATVVKLSVPATIFVVTLMSILLCNC
jgi:hypothetical protein